MRPRLDHGFKPDKICRIERTVGVGEASEISIEAL
jgi:hypothetical protein